ncbi:MAG: hypothetical protein U9N87_09480 [Planctomycetota bacterium]|nr:hypothetical protein [Planctomycetota bacterium]
MGRMIDALKQIEDNADEQSLDQPVAAVGSGPEAELSFPDDLLSGTAALLDELQASEEVEQTPAEMHLSVGVQAPAGEQTPIEQPEAIISDGKPRTEICSRDSRHLDLAANILGQLPADGSVSLLFAGMDAGGVHVSSLLPLFSTLAEQVEGRTLVVECDFRRAALARRFSVEPRFGLADVLSSLATWPSAVCPSEQPGLDVLCSYSAGSGAAGSGFEQFALDHQRSIFATMLTEMREQYRLVLFENVSASDREMSQLAAYCHGVYLLLRAGQTPRDAARQSLKMINRGGGQLLGCVLLDA